MTKYKYKQSIVLLLLIFAFSSCFSDKGNYDYKDLILFDIDTVGTGIGTELTAYQFENLKVPISVKYDGDLKDLKYEWKIYPQRPVYDEETLKYGDPIIISNRAVLDTILYVTPDNYYLAFTVHDTNRDIKQFFNVKLNVQTRISKGLCILEESNGHYDLSLIGSSKFIDNMDNNEQNVYYNLFTGVNNIEVPNGKFLGYAQKTNNIFYFFTDNGGFIINPNTFEVISSDYKGFFSFGMSIGGSPRAFMQTTRPMQVIVDNGLIYIWDAMSFGATSFGDRLAGDYYAASFLPRISTSKFSTVIYDEKNNRFAPIDQFGSNVGNFTSNTAGAFDLNNVGANKKLVFMDNGFNGFTYSVFLDSSSSKYELYIADFAGTGDPTPVSVISMDNCPGINSESDFDFANRGNICFYSSNSNLYLYKYSTTNTAEVIKTFSGEVITGIKIFKDAEHSKDGKLLFVSTVKDGNGKMYLIDFNELNGNLVENTIEVFDGFGRIVDILMK